MFQRFFVAAFASALGFAAATPVVAASCFTPDEAKAAQFRTLQQELNVAALNCRTIDPSDPGFTARYNDFVGKFGGKLQENAEALRGHFARAGGSFDVWMTKVANDAGQRVFTDPEYCQRAWENLDKTIALEPAEVEGFASSAVPSRSYVPVCGEEKGKTKGKAKATKVKAAKKKPAKQDDKV